MHYCFGVSLFFQVAFGEVQASSPLINFLGKKDKIKLPSLLLICNGDLQLAERYQARLADAG
jgi:hypothetical protein